MKGRIRASILGVCWTFLAVAGGAFAQTTAEVNAGVQFNFSTPGARSLGLGGAFLGLADDATAAYANPAGLTILSKPEVSLEARHWSYQHTFTDGGRLYGSPTGEGVDTVAGLRIGHAESTVTGLSFLSAVYPGRRWAVALYRHELANYEADFKTDGVFTRPATTDEEGARTRPKINSFDLMIVNFGLSAAFRVTDQLSLGAGVSAYDFSLRSRTDRYDNRAPDTGPGGLFGPPLYTPENLVDTQIQKGDDRKIGFNAGFLWHVTDSWSFGGVYRQGPDFDLDATYIRGPLAPSSAHNDTKPARYKVPDVFGLGAAVQPTELTTVTLDYVRVQYSDLNRSIVNILLLLPNPATDLRFKVDDANEIHLGFERNFPLRRSLLAARIGSWYDPDHRLRYVGSVPGLQAAFRPGKDEIHYSAGIGFISPRLKLQADAAFDYSAPVKTASHSGVWRF
jgi:long-subunit fatty acid transport protein